MANTLSLDLGRTEKCKSETRAIGWYFLKEKTMCNTESNDPVNNPSHYLKAAITVEPIELTARLDPCLGQALQNESSQTK